MKNALFLVFFISLCVSASEDKSLSNQQSNALKTQPSSSEDSLSLVLAQYSLSSSHSYSCSGDGKIKVDGVKTPFSSITLCMNGGSVTYTCTESGMRSILTPNSPYCANR